ncbi:hypothetical protein C8R43DRAFT_5152 [Mycena crocata]|nr:hypothetical protein C8R43DRAFT_5152 [Mycena crocata]
MPRTTADNVFFGFAASLTTLSFFRPFEAARLVGGVLTFGGTFGILQPLQLAHAFGIKWADAKSSVFVPGIGARNLAAGLTVSILAIKGPAFVSFLTIGEG